MQSKYLFVSMLVVVSLLLTGCLNQNSDFSFFGDNNDDGGSSNTITLIHSIQMFDFSTGQYVSESFTTEDIDAIVITTDGKIRLYAHNDAVIKKQGDAEYSSYIDVSEGTTCILQDSAGGIATFTVNTIGTSTEGYPSCTITWSYSS